MAGSKSSNAMLAVVQNLGGVLGNLSQQMESVEFNGTDAQRYISITLDAMMGIKSIAVNWNNFFADYFHGISPKNEEYVRNAIQRVVECVADAQANAVGAIGASMQQPPAADDNEGGDVVNFEDFTQQ